MTLPGAPMIYYGGEVGLLGETDPDCRRCMPWDQKEWNQPVYEMTRALVAFRHAHPAVRYGKPEKLSAFNGLFAYRMAYDGDEVLVVLNPREAIANYSLPAHSTAATWVEAFTGQKFTANSDSLCLDIPSKSTLVLVPA